MNAQLRTCAYPPVSIKVDHSAEYKGSLEAWQVDGDATAFMDLFLDCLHEELEKRIAFLLQGAPDEGPYPFDVKRGEEMLGILYYQPASTASSLAQIMGLSGDRFSEFSESFAKAGSSSTPAPTARESGCCAKTAGIRAGKLRSGGPRERAVRTA